MRETRGNVEMELLRKRRHRAEAGGADTSSPWPEACRGSGELELEELNAPSRFNEVEDGLAVRSLDDFFVCDAETGEPFQLEQLDDLKAAAEKEEKAKAEAGEATQGEGEGTGAAAAAVAAAAAPTSTIRTPKGKKKRRIMAFGTLVLPLPMGLRVRYVLSTMVSATQLTYAPNTKTRRAGFTAAATATASHAHRDGVPHKHALEAQPDTDWYAGGGREWQ